LDIIFKKLYIYITNALFMNPRIFLIAFLIITSWSCKKEKAVIAGFDNSAKVIATIKGTVLDENGKPQDGVMVTCNDKLVYTKNLGQFTFDSVLVFKNSQVLKLEAHGYFKMYRTVSNEDKKETYTIIKMEKKENPVVFGSMAGAIIQKNGVTIELPSRGYKYKKTGKAFDGQVYAYTKVISPNTDDFIMQLPGNTTGIDSAAEQVSLGIFSAVGVELEDVSGQELELAENATAKVIFPINAQQIKSAKQTVNLWHFDVLKGMWVEAGNMEKVGNTYQGTVNHFSYWMPAIPMPVAKVQAAFTDSFGNPLAATIVTLRDQNSGFAFGAFINKDGNVRVLVPAFQKLLLELKGLNCPTNLYSTNVQVGGSHSVLDLGTINIGQNPNVAIIEGTFVDCNNNPIPETGGYIKVNGNSIFIMGDALGHFSQVMVICGGAASCEIEGYDSLQYNKATYTITNGINNIGNFQCCGKFRSYISFSGSIDSAGALTFFELTPGGGGYGITGCPNYLESFFIGANLNSSGSTTVSCGAFGSGYFIFMFNFSFDGNGTSGNQTITALDSDNYYNGRLSGWMKGTACNIPITITEYSQVPNQGYIKGNFNGKFYDQSGCKMNLVGDFVVERNF
jgi:hypothetical protein